jgi:hypothetical protein
MAIRLTLKQCGKEGMKEERREVGCSLDGDL